jgi:predicted DNA-binding transcriptional regulator YafY
MDKHIKAIHNLRRMHDLIQKECTGTPGECADLLQISRAQLYRIINKLKDYGARIKFNRSRNTFTYNGYFDLKETPLYLLLS